MQVRSWEDTYDDEVDSAPRDTDIPLNVLQSLPDVKRRAILKFNSKAKALWESAKEIKKAEVREETKAAGKPPKRYLILDSDVNKNWTIEDATDDVVQWGKDHPDTFRKFYDTETGSYVKPGKKQPIKDKRARPQYGEIPGDLEALAEPVVYNKSQDEYRQHVTKDGADDWGAYFEIEHKNNVNNALLLGALTAERAEKIGHFKTYPDLAEKYKAEEKAPKVEKAKEKKPKPAAKEAKPKKPPEGKLRFARTETRTPEFEEWFCDR